jgi:hypothetical protein
MRKFWLLGFISVILSANYIAVRIYDIKHPRSEPRGLYIVDFKSDLDRTVRRYRIYCPTGMVRDITHGKWKKARKAYLEDHYKYGGNYVVREVFETVCE